MHMFFTTFRFALIAIIATLMSQGAEAQTPAPVPDSAVIDACRATDRIGSDALLPTSRRSSTGNNSRAIAAQGAHEGPSRRIAGA